jgi:type I restriction enzyme R subunit
MWKGKSLTKVNVISACLGLHLPFPVSSTMVEVAAITLNMFMGSKEVKVENRAYQSLLSLRWASDYGDIYDDLKVESMESLIKQPPI